jgi:putative peptide zinc metalloprotease protein
MTATSEPPATAAQATEHPPLNRGEGVELLGAVHGSGYRDGASLVRRGDGQMVQLRPLMYGLLECVDGERDAGELATAVSEHLGRRLDEKHVVALAQKLAAQGLLAGTEQNAPPRRNPLLALRWKVLVTNPAVTNRLTAPFTFLFRPWLMWPILAAFAGVFWFVLFHKGVASATAQAFHSPGLLLLVFALTVASAGFHELGHASACRYGGATPGGMGMGLYLVWPAFYTDVTDSYRLSKRARLRVDLGGMYFNAVIAVITMGVWLLWHVDALLLLIALQVLEMVKNLSPVIRSDGYHILSDATGIPDLFSHIGPTMRRLLPGHRHEPSALAGKARVLVTVWVLIVVPVLLSMLFSAVLLFPKLATSAWASGRHIAVAIPHDAGHGQILDLLSSIVRLLALFLPVMGSALVTQKMVRSTVGKARAWSAGQPVRRAVVTVAGAALIAGLAWAWWPSGQYQPVHANDNGTLAGYSHLISSPASAVRPVAAAAPVRLAPGTHLAVSMIPVGGATKRHPALFVIAGKNGKPAVAILSDSTPDPSAARGGTSANRPSPTAGTTTTATPSGSTTASAPPTSTTAAGTPTTTTPAPGAGSATSTSPTTATAFPFKLPAAPGPGDTQAVAVGTKDGGVTYDVAYSLVTVKDGAPVTNTNSAFALAHCNACTTVAVSFQVVLVVGESKDIAPINAAGALNYQCPACTTTAIADQIVVTLTAQPSQALLAELDADLKQLNALSALGAGGTPAAIAAEVTTIQQEVDTQITGSGLRANQADSTTGASPPSPTGTSTSGSSPTTPTTTTSSTTTAPTVAGQPTSSSSSTTPSGSSPAPPASPTTTTTAQTTTTTTTTSTQTSPTTSTTTTTTSAAPSSQDSAQATSSTAAPAQSPSAP